MSDDIQTFFGARLSQKKFPNTNQVPTIQKHTEWLKNWIMYLKRKIEKDFNKDFDIKVNSLRMNKDLCRCIIWGNPLYIYMYKLRKNYDD